MVSREEKRTVCIISGLSSSCVYGLFMGTGNCLANRAVFGSSDIDFNPYSCQNYQILKKKSHS